MAEEDAPDEVAATLLEVISPAGLERLFRTFNPGEPPNPEALMAMAREYGCQVDFAATIELAAGKSLSM